MITELKRLRPEWGPASSKDRSTGGQAGVPGARPVRAGVEAGVPGARPVRAGVEAGFSLVETVIAMGILATGLLSLAGVFSLGMLHLAGSSANLIAREKAREAVESVHTARDTKTITWSEIKNVVDGGVFLKEALKLRKPGLDGLVNTADDANEDVEEQLGPGPDNQLGTSDDQHIPLNLYTRQILIEESLGPNGEDTLRKLTVIVKYPVGTTQREYKLTTFISSIS